jgi:soluble lytic murein transglycosylase-like protein
MDLVALSAACALGSGSPLRPAHCAARPDHRVLVAASAVDLWQPFTAEASQRFGIPEAWIRAVVQIERAGLMVLDGRSITAPAGAMGLIILMPETYAEDTAAPRARRRSRRPP